MPVTPGVRMHDLLTVNLDAGTIDHVINDTGAPVTTAAPRLRRGQVGGHDGR